MRAEPRRDEPQSLLDARKVARGNYRLAFARERRRAERRDARARRRESRERFDHQKVSRALRRFWVAQNIFQVPAAARRRGACGEKAYERACRVANVVNVLDLPALRRWYGDEFRDRADLPDSMRIEKTVFIKAPRSMPYADVVRVLDGLKGAGASPIGLQIDDLN